MPVQTISSFHQAKLQNMDVYHGGSTLTKHPNFKAAAKAAAGRLEDLLPKKRSPIEERPRDYVLFLSIGIAELLRLSNKEMQFGVILNAAITKLDDVRCGEEKGWFEKRWQTKWKAAKAGLVHMNLVFDLIDRLC